MPFLRFSRSLVQRPYLRSNIALLPTRTFSSSPLRPLKEDHKDPSGHEAEQLKQQQLKKQEKGEGHWHEGLASAGESNVKADQQHVEDHDKHMKELQQEGKEKAHKGEI